MMAVHVCTDRSGLKTTSVCLPTGIRLLKSHYNTSNIDNIDVNIIESRMCTDVSCSRRYKKKHTVEQKAENFFTQYIHRQAY